MNKNFKNPEDKDNLCIMLSLDSYQNLNMYFTKKTKTTFSKICFIRFTCRKLGKLIYFLENHQN